MRRHRRIAAFACALTLAAPAAALGQSAGDDQYQDPFSGQQPQSQPQNQGSQGDAGGGGGNTGSGAGTQSAQATPAEPGAGTSQAGSGDGATLPRTGFMAALPLAWGLVLLLSGAALKRGARSRNR